MDLHKNTAIALTWFRIAAIPLFALVFYLPFAWARPAAGWLFGLAAVTDWLDGYIARRFGQQSSFGAFLDPVADKLIVVVALVLLVSRHPTIPVTVIAIIIIGREITISALREWMAELGARHQVAVSGFGKSKTITQMFGIAFMLHETELWGMMRTYEPGFVLLLIAAALTMWSMVRYLLAAAPALRAGIDPPS